MSNPNQPVNVLAKCLGSVEEVFTRSKDPPTVQPEVTRCFLYKYRWFHEGGVKLELRARSPSQNDSVNVPHEAPNSNDSSDEPYSHELIVPCGTGAFTFVASPESVRQILAGCPPNVGFVRPSLTQNIAYRDECATELPCNGSPVRYDVQLQWLQRDSQNNDTESDLTNSENAPAGAGEAPEVTQCSILKDIEGGLLKVDLRIVRYGPDLTLPDSAGSLLSIPCGSGFIELAVTPETVCKLLEGDLSMSKIVSLEDTAGPSPCEMCTMRVPYPGGLADYDVLIHWREYTFEKFDLESQEERLSGYDSTTLCIREALEQPTLPALVLRLIGGWIFERPRDGKISAYIYQGLGIFIVWVSLLASLFGTVWKRAATTTLYCIFFIPTVIMALCFVFKCALAWYKKPATWCHFCLENLCIGSFVFLFGVWTTLVLFKTLPEHVQNSLFSQ